MKKIKHFVDELDIISQMYDLTMCLLEGTQYCFDKFIVRSLLTYNFDKYRMFIIQYLNSFLMSIFAEESAVKNFAERVKLADSCTQKYIAFFYDI